MNVIAFTKEPAPTFNVEGVFLPFEIEIGGHVIQIAETVFVQLIVSLILGCIFFFLGRNLKVRPESRRQLVAETIVGFFIDTVVGTMGEKYKHYANYIGALMCFSLISSLMGLLGLRTPTSDLSVIAAWGLITLSLVNINRFKSGGLKGYINAFFQPMPFLFPSNIIGEIGAPFSQTLRHFANILAGSIIMGLIYYSLSGVLFGFGAIGLPAVLSLYFDLFASIIQAFIFATLTMIYVLNGECGD